MKKIFISTRGKRNLNKIYKGDVTYDNIKSYKKAGLHSVSRKYIFGNTTEVGVKLTPKPF